MKKLELRPLPWGTRTFIMGIINVTPDSFSGDGLIGEDHFVEAALQQSELYLRDGADILDVGGESTRPGAEAVSEEEELARVIPVIEALVNNFPSVQLSIDTYKSAVAAKALEEGAQWVNDIWGLRADPELAAVIAAAGVPVILMHNRLAPGRTELRSRLGGRYIGSEYKDLIGEIKEELMKSVELAHRSGISDERIILDPGIGFGKTVSQNLELLDRLDEIKALGYPLLVGPSRKSFIGYTLNLPPDERVEGTAAAVALSIDRGADIIRVHDVGVMTRVARMADAIIRREEKSISKS
ncbi:MAG: dihydropteroate synthase [Chloroflexota bacterium]|jgi:dihydropteroate synthase|nr:dihydropteroate synthase [Chloroflexota bacterium]